MLVKLTLDQQTDTSLIFKRIFVIASVVVVVVVVAVAVVVVGVDLLSDNKFC